MSVGLTQVLVVLEDAKELDSLRASLAKLADRHECFFFSTSREAFKVLDGKTVGIVVSDLGTAGVGGMDFLRDVHERWPHVSRVAIASESSGNLAVQSLGYVHRLIKRPYSGDQIRELLDEVLATRERVHSTAVQSLVNHMNGLPSPSETYRRLVRELREPETDMQKIGSIIARDIAMGTKILQIANSSYFSPKNPIRDPLQATTMLGKDLIRSMVVSAGLFQSFDEKRITVIDLGALLEHSLRVQDYSRRLAKLEDFSAEVQEEAAIAGLVHDIGKVVMACNLPDSFGRCIAFAKQRKRAPHEIERAMMKADHASVGAYLLGLWGFGYGIVEAVAMHIEPFHQFEGSRPSVGAILRFCEAYDRTSTGHRAPEHFQADRESFERKYGTPRLKSWLETLEAEPTACAA